MGLTTLALNGCATITYLIELAGIAAVAGLSWRHRTRPPLNSVAWLTLAVVAGSLAVAPVLSPQYILWLIAAACVVRVCERTRASRLMVAVVCAAAALTQLEYPVLFNHIVKGRLDGLIVAETRNVLLIVIAVIATAAGVRRARSAKQSETSQHGSTPVVVAKPQGRSVTSATTRANL